MRSLATLVKQHENVQKWTLILPKDFTLEESIWFQSIKDQYKQLEIDLWDETHLRFLLNKHLSIRRDYFPIPEELEEDLHAHFESIKTKVIQSYAQNY